MKRYNQALTFDECVTKNQKIHKNLEARNILIPSLFSLTLTACGGSSNLLPVAAPDSTLTLDEDSNAVPINIAAPTDEDVNDTLTIKVDTVPSGGEIRTASGEVVTAGSTLTIDELTGLTFTPNQDFNSDQQTIGTFQYTVSDQAGGSDSSTVTFQVNPIQDPPTITSAIDFSIDENTTAVTTIIGEDPDGDSLTYSISGGSDGALFQIDSSSGEISFIEKPDYENPLDDGLDNIYEVEVSVDDGNGNTASQTILITVNNTDTSMTLSGNEINENDSGVNVGSLNTYIDDTSATGSVSYSVSGSGSENFEIVDGELKLKDGVQLDFESKSSYSLIITATDDGGPSTSFEFTITVNDQNDAPTGVSLSSLGVPEQLDGADIGTVTVSDQDAGDTFTYSISDDRFEIVDGVLKLKSGNTVAYSEEQTISLSITVTDAAGEEFTQEFTLIVGSIQISSTSFSENSSGVIVGDLSITDPDFSSNVTYTLSGADSANFEVINGQLKLKDDFSADFETKSSYSITITATDDAGSEASLTYTISVLDVNESPTAVNLSASVIDENVDGAIVGDLTTTDVDAGDAHTYELTGADADSFEVVDGQLKLKAGVSANFENKSTYSVTVTTTDSGGLTLSKDFAVTINDVNDPVILSTAISNQSNDEDSAFSFTVPSNTFTDEDGDTLTYTATLEDGSALPTWLSFNSTTGTFTGTPLNDDVGTIVVTVTASDGSSSVSDTFNLTVVNTNDDPTAVNLSASVIDENVDGAIVGDLTTDDVDVGDSHTYTLSGADADSFEVVDGQLKLKAGVSANFENKSTYSVTVTTRDVFGSTFAQSFNVTITDVNEAPTSITLSASAIDENATGAVVGTLNTADVDAGDTFTYEISGADADSFEIVEGKLQLKSDISADYETQTSYSVTVTATDSGGLTTAEDFTVNVNNLNDNSPSFTSSNSVEMAENSNSVITVEATDADGDSLTYSISGGNDSGLFTIDSTTGELTLQAKTNSLTTTATSLPFKLTNKVDNGDGTYTFDIEIDPSVASFAAINNFTIIFNFDSSKISFDKNDVTIDIDSSLELITSSSGTVQIQWASASFTNDFTGGKVGSITITPTAGAVDPQITIEGTLAGGVIDSTDSTNSSSTTIYSWTEIRTDLDFEDPQDSDGDNIYEVTVTVSDGLNSTTQDISVTVTDVSESGKQISESDNGSDGGLNPDDLNDDSVIPNIDADDFDALINIHYSFDFIDYMAEENTVNQGIENLIDHNFDIDLSNTINDEEYSSDALSEIVQNVHHSIDYPMDDISHEAYYYEHI